MAGTDFVEAALMGGHGCAVSVMLALGADELAAAATAGDDPAELAHFWYFTGDFSAAVRAGDAVGLDGEPVLDAIARLALGYREDSGEVLFRLACERQVLTARGSDWNSISPARRAAWTSFAEAANRVFAVLTAAAGARTMPPPVVPALAETIFAEDHEADADPERGAAVAAIVAADAAARKADTAAGKADTAPGEPAVDAAPAAALLSVAAPPPGIGDADPDKAKAFTAFFDSPISTNDMMWREIAGLREAGKVLALDPDGRLRVEVDGMAAHAASVPAEANAATPPGIGDAEPDEADALTTFYEPAIRKGDRVWRDIGGRREAGTVLTAHRNGRLRVDVDGIAAHAAWDPAEAAVHRDDAAPSDAT